MVFRNENIKKGPKITAEPLNNADYDGNCFGHNVSEAMAFGHFGVLKKTHIQLIRLCTQSTSLLYCEGEETHLKIKLMTYLKEEDI